MSRSTFGAMTDLKLIRILSLAGLAYAALQVAGDLTIGPFPDGNTSTASLSTYYAVHHGHVAMGGYLMAWSAVCLGLFGAVLAWRVRSLPITAAIIAVGAGAALASAEFSASTYFLLGNISTSTHLDPAALQAWHLTGSEFGIGIGQGVLLLGVAIAAVVGRILPAWVGWSAVVIAIGHLTPLGFLASLLFLLWCAAVGLTLSIRSDVEPSVTRRKVQLQQG
jgi:hypothetical protein